MDDATSTIYSAFLVEEEGTASTFCGLLDVFVAHGLPCALYTDRGSHYFHTAKAGEAVDKNCLTQVGRALDRLGIEHIPAYSPEARGRSERVFGTLQDRLVKELEQAGIDDIATANQWIRDVYLPRHNARFARPPTVAEKAFVAADPGLLSETLCIEEERVVGRDNTVAYAGLRLQGRTLTSKTAPGVRSAFPRIAATKSGQLMCYENRTTAKATDINRPEINRTHTNGTPSTQATCSHCVTYDACARSPATAAEALRGGRRVS